MRISAKLYSTSLILIILSIAFILDSLHTQAQVSTPFTSSGIKVKIDEDHPELWEFNMNALSLSQCGVEAVEEDGGVFGNPDETGIFYGTPGGIVKHKGSNSLSGAVPCSGGDDPCKVIRFGWRDSIDSKCGPCSLSTGSRSYRPKGDLLCGYDGKWYLCDQYYHNGQDRLFKSGESGFVCTKNNEWYSAETCDNNVDDDSDGKIDCSDDNCYGLIQSNIFGANIGAHPLPENKLAYFNAKCDPDLSQVACDSAGSPAIAFDKPAYSYQQALPANKCCGDDEDDCGKAASGYLCKIEPSTKTSSWIQSTSSNSGEINYVGCARAEFLSDGTAWQKCDGTFWKKTVGDREYICQGRGKGSIVECAGDSTPKSSGAGKRLSTGKVLSLVIFRTKKFLCL